MNLNKGFLRVFRDIGKCQDMLSETSGYNIGPKKGGRRKSVQEQTNGD